MTRAYDDVFSDSLFRPHPLASFRVHVMRDPRFTPHGIALEVAPAGIPHVALDGVERSGPVVLHWALDMRSHLEPGEQLHISTRSYGPGIDEESDLRQDLGDRIWHGWLPPDAVEIHDMRDEVRAIIDPRDLPLHGPWRIAWGYELTLSAGAVIADRIDPWVVIQTR